MNKTLSILRDIIVKELGVDVTELSRCRELSDAVKIFVYIATDKGYTRAAVGDFLGRNHSTITHLLRVYSELYQYCAEFRNKANTILSIIEYEIDFRQAVGLLY